MTEPGGKTRPNVIWGGLRFIQKHRVSGWAFAPRRPEEHLHVEIRLDGAVIATALADVAFDHLERAGICPADHGFAVETEALLPVEAPERIEVSAICAGGERLRLRLPPGDGEARGPAAAAKLVRFAAADRSQHPIFVLGSARSGTSAMGRALRRSLRFAGHGEGHLLNLLPRLLSAVGQHYRDEAKAASAGQFTMLAGVPEALVAEGVRSLFVKLMRAEFPGGRWMEKTPGPAMIRAAPLLREVWPNARFIFMQRRGIENMQSRLRKFPELDFEEHCRAWAEAMRAWLEVREPLGAAAIAVDQYDLARSPDAVAGRVAGFAGLDAAEAALLAEALRDERPQQTGDDVSAVSSLDQTGWSAAQLAAFREICGEAMAQFGYTEDAAYRTAALLPSGQRIQ